MRLPGAAWPWLALPFGTCAFPLWAIQTFSCGGSFARAFEECDPNVSVRRIEASFRKRNISRSTLASLAVVLRTCTCRHGYWHCGSPLDCRFRGMIFVCMTRSVLVSTVRTLDQRLLVAPLLEVSFSCWFSCLSYVCCDVVAIRCCLLCFRWYWPSLEGSMDWARAYLRNAPEHALGPGLVQAEA